MPKLIDRVDFSLADAGDADLPAFDYTRLTAILTCPTYGIVRFGLGRTFSDGSRAMALDAGSAMHEFFAAIRLADLAEQLGHVDELVENEGIRLFKDRWADGSKLLFSNEDRRQRELAFGLHMLNTSGFYDDPSDKRRTMTKLEECAIAYYDRWPTNRGRSQIWLSDDKKLSGIELGFNLKVVIHTSDGEAIKFRYTGRLDGLHVHDGCIVVHENKTGSRINEAWSAGMLMSHQITGYTIAATVMTNQPCARAYAHGLQVPLPAYSSQDLGVVRDKLERTEHHVERWVSWVAGALNLHKQFHTDPYEAPRFTHSCNRYFRPCPLVPLCDTGDEEQFYQTIDDMEYKPWSPIDDSVDA